MGSNPPPEQLFILLLPTGLAVPLIITSSTAVRRGLGGEVLVYFELKKVYCGYLPKSLVQVRFLR